MIYYWIPFILALLNCLIKNKKVNQMVIVLCCIYILLLCTLRDPSVGTDSYKYAMMATGGRDYSSPFEFLYNLILPIVGTSQSGYTYFFFIMAALTWIPKNFVLSRTSGNYSKYLFLLLIISNNIYFLDSVNAIRQMASTAMIVTSYYFLEKKKKIFFLIFYVLAIGLHTTAAIYIPFVLLSRIELKPKLMIGILVVAVVYSFLFSFMVDASLFTTVLGKVGFLGISDYVGYFGQERYMNGVNAKGLIKLLIFPALLCAFSILRVNNRSTRVYFWGLILTAVLSPITALSVRACMGLTAAEILVFPEVWKNGTKEQRMVMGIYLVVFSLYFAYALITIYSDPEQLGPYVFNQF